jgi:putative ABC transport system ATP-binding protein
VTVDGRRIDLMSEEELAVWRGEHVGVVFQFFQLLPTLSALENAVLPLDIARRPAAGTGRGRLARRVQLPERLEVLVRDHPAVGARADLEHDDDAGRRADI